MYCSCIHSCASVEDSGTEVERRPLVPNLGPGFESCDERVLPLGFFHTIGASTGYVSRKQTSSAINISLFRNRCKINKFQLFN